MTTQKTTIQAPINFGGSGTVPDAVLTSIGTPTIYIAEFSVTNPVTFTSAMYYVFAQDMSTATGATVTELRVNATLAFATTATYTNLSDLTNSGENWGGIFWPLDFTTHFVSNFGTGKSKTCTTQVYFDISTGTTLSTNGVTGYWEITYEYDDSEADRTQTIAIPMESITSTLTTTADTPYCTIPQLTGGGGWLNGYASPVIRHIWAEVKGCSGTSGSTTAQTLNWGFNGVGGGGSLDSRNNSLASDTFQFGQIDLSSLTLSSTNTLDLWSSVASRYPCLVVTVLCRSSLPFPGQRAY